MLFHYRITKYDPLLRNEHGHFLTEDWTSISDIGRTFAQRLLTQSAYQLVEDAYLSTIELFLNEAQISAMTLAAIEGHGTDISFKKGTSIGFKDILSLSRLTLREELWAKFTIPGKAYIHFGYDYYMYLGVPIQCKSAINSTHELGLFVESFRSPYLRAFPSRS
jgi:hypothetical protein